MNRIGFSAHPLIAIPPVGYGAVERILYDRACLLAEKGLQIHLLSRPRTFRPSFFYPNFLSPRDTRHTVSKDNLFFHYCSVQRYVFYDLSLRIGKDTFYEYISREAKKNFLNTLHVAYPNYTSQLKNLLGNSVKIVTEIHTSIDEKHTVSLFELSRASDLILTVSDFVGSFAHSLTDKPVETLYNAVDSNLFRPDRSGIKNNIIVCSSKFMYWKGQHVLLEALKKIDLTGWQVFFTGPPAEPSYFYKCVEMGRSISKNIHFLGFIRLDDLVKLYAKAAIFVCPSIGFEAFGLVNIEAMSCGCAVIASRIGGIPEIVENDKIGILIKPNDASSLANSLNLLMSDLEIRKKLGENARMRVLAKFTYRHHVDNLINIYKKHGLI
jgi:glycosyltransferase involved in cell wall biosynthesis